MPGKRRTKQTALRSRRKPRSSSNPLLDLDLGQSFAEYDPCLEKKGAYVRTPAIKAAADPSTRHCFFVGRRGTGKTATALLLSRTNGHACQVLPQQLIPDDLRGFTLTDFRDTRQRPFKSLVAATIQTLLLEAIRHWLSTNTIGRHSLGKNITRHINSAEQEIFDERLINRIDTLLSPLQKSQSKDWLRLIKLHESLSAEIATITPTPPHTTIVVDRIDEAWDGSDTAVVFLMSLMHACIETTTLTKSLVRPILFLRENIFERVRQIDNEFARLETAVVSMDWSSSQLQELIERRVNLRLITKKALGGDTWRHVFQDIENKPSIDFVAEYCQHRPRDVLTYCTFAIDAAKARTAKSVDVDDLLAARQRFSDSRLKDLGDEYAENFPNISLVLARFFGLGKKFSMPGIASFIQRLLVDVDVQNNCKSWINNYTVPESFADLLYRISFFGISSKFGFVYRNAGARSTMPPKITSTSQFSIHPCFHDALHLQDKTIAQLDDQFQLRVAGVVHDLPEGATLDSYQNQLRSLLEELDTLPTGSSHAQKFEDVVGQIIRLCFFRYLTNIAPRSRTADGRSIRDWICANTAPEGFWEMVRLRYDATQVVWECKNYKTLKADDFHQCSYYMNNAMGRCAIIAYRGIRGSSPSPHAIEIKRKQDGIVLVLGDRDLKVFLRQAIKGKAREAHLRDVFDQLVRSS
ncbi:MAG: transposase [Planctomycetota bacterium]